MIGYSTQRRRRQIRAKGRPMTLESGDGKTVSLTGYAPPPTIATIDGSVPRQSYVAQITNDELAAAGYTKPGNGDTLTDGPRRYTLTDASPVYDRGALCGWVLIAAGGT